LLKFVDLFGYGPSEWRGNTMIGRSSHRTVSISTNGREFFGTGIQFRRETPPVLVEKECLRDVPYLFSPGPDGRRLFIGGDDACATVLAVAFAIRTEPRPSSATGEIDGSRLDAAFSFCWQV
jgi:hypothetical protein